MEAARVDGAGMLGTYGRIVPPLLLVNLAQVAQPSNDGASMVGASLPTLVVYIILGKYFIGGLMSGSVKS